VQVYKEGREKKEESRVKVDVFSALTGLWFGHSHCWESAGKAKRQGFLNAS